MKRLIAFFKEPPVWFALLWALLTGGMIALSAAVSSSGAKEEPFAAVLYGFTALSLSYSIYAPVKWVPKVKLAAKTRLSRNKYADTFLASYTVRTVVYSSLSTLLDFAYVVVNGVTAIRYHSVWYYALAAYYFALMVIRLFVILCAGQGLKKYGSESRAFDERKLNIYLVSGVALLLLEASLSGVITLMIVLPKETQTGFVLAIANAAYTFTRVILPLTMPGIFAGSIQTFIPSLGFFFISDMMGGAKTMYIGNLIKNQFLSARNWPLGAVLSIVLIVITLILMRLYTRVGSLEDMA